MLSSGAVYLASDSFLKALSCRLGRVCGWRKLSQWFSERAVFDSSLFPESFGRRKGSSWSIRKRINVVRIAYGQIVASRSPKLQPAARATPPTRVAKKRMKSPRESEAAS